MKKSNIVHHGDMHHLEITLKQKRTKILTLCNAIGDLFVQHFKNCELYVIFERNLVSYQKSKYKVPVSYRTVFNKKNRFESLDFSKFYLDVNNLKMV